MKNAQGRVKNPSRDMRLARNYPNGERPWKTGRGHSKQDSDSGILIGLPRICSYMGISESQIDRLIGKCGFPVSVMPDGQFITSKALITSWIVTAWQIEAKLRGWKNTHRPHIDYLIAIADRLIEDPYDQAEGKTPPSQRPLPDQPESKHRDRERKYREGERPKYRAVGGNRDKRGIGRALAYTSDSAGAGGASG